MKSLRHRSPVLALGACVLLVGTAGVAASSGPGAGPWLLGTDNHARQTTKLVSGAGLDKATVSIRNKGDGPALSLSTGPGRAPLKVNSDTRVDRLNADRIDGLDSSQLVRSDQAVDADTLGGKGPHAYVQVPPAPLTVLVRQTDPQAVPDTVPTPLSTYFELYDPSGMHDSATPGLLRAPRPGTYMVSATVTWAPDDVGWRSLELRYSIDSTVIARVTAPAAGASVPTVQTVTGVVHMDAVQGAFLVASQSSGGGALGATMTAFEMAYVGS